MDRKRVNVTMYEEDILMLEELTKYFNRQSIAEVTPPSVMRNAVKLLYKTLKAQGKLDNIK